SLAQMTLRTIIANRLSDLVIAELADHHRANDKCNAKCRQHPQNAAKRQILKDVEKRHVAFEIVRQPEQHQGCSWCLQVRARNASITFSMAVLREPLINIILLRSFCCSARAIAAWSSQAKKRPLAADTLSNPRW